MKKQYRVARSLFGTFGSLRRNAVLAGDDPRIADNKRAFDLLVKRKLLVEENIDDDKPSAAPAKGKSGHGKAD
ncbi:hypothetical protein [Mesorhizobium sp. BE184]|uniref:hypothetical protein n=1 Tax=Mesorhizobium sp. BE184 TaxID=2817714 RepID=UPI002854203A|nr:hypothetical protein [Mesorhizobium sp. BE184]MDR7034500.1 hypothetical protein [Mesorhizobium sp. BE184]